MSILGILIEIYVVTWMPHYVFVELLPNVENNIEKEEEWKEASNCSCVGPIICTNHLSKYVVIFGW